MRDPGQGRQLSGGAGQSTRLWYLTRPGTLTHGTFQVTAVHPRPGFRGAAAGAGRPGGELFRPSHFPLSPGKHISREPDTSRVWPMWRRYPAKAFARRVDGRRVCAGNGKLMDAAGAKWHDCHLTGTVVHVAVDGDYAGHIVISDEVKPDAAQAIAAPQERRACARP